MNRRTLALPAVAVALAAVVGVSAAGRPATAPEATAGRAERVPVRHTDTVCAQSAVPGDTPVLDAYAPGPVKGSEAGKGRTALQGLTGGTTYPGPTSPGGSAHAALKKGAASVVASAEDGLAPGFTLQQTGTVASGTGRGLSGLACPQPGTSFWFSGASLAGQRSDTVTVVNTGAETATVDIDLFGPDGAVSADSGKGIPLDPGKSEQIPLDSLTKEKPGDLAVHVSSRSGRVAATLQAVDGENGSDWLPVAAAGTDLVVPGIPGDSGDVRLIVSNPGRDDTTLAIRVAGKSGTLTPAGHDTIDVPGGATAGVDLGNIAHGEASALILTPAPGAPAATVTAGARVQRGSAGNRDTAFLASSAPVGERADAAGNVPGKSTLYLTAPGKSPSVVEVEAAGGAGKRVTVPGGSTVGLPVPAPAGAAAGKGKKGGDPFGISLTTVSGGPVHAARMIADKRGGVSMFTVQPLGDDRSQVTRPAAREDDTVLFGD